MSLLSRTLFTAAIFSLGSFSTVGCANVESESTGSVTAGFTDGSTYTAEGSFAVTPDASNTNVVVSGRLVEPTTGDALDLALTLPLEGGAHRETDVDCELTLVHANAKKNVSVHVVVDDYARHAHGVTGHLVLKSDVGSPVLTGSIDLR